MRYFAIGDEDAVLGFGLAGVPGRAVRNAEEASGAFREALADGETGIVIITERAAELLREEVDAYVFTQDFPLIVEVPDRTGRLPGRPNMRELANRAIGIKL